MSNPDLAARKRLTKRTSALQRQETLIGYAFILPALIVFLVFVAFPFFASIGLSFTKWNFLGGWKKLKWVGLQNFANLARDRRFGQAFANTFIYSIATVPTSILLALVLAYILNNKVYCRKLLRMAFFIPTSPALWRWLPYSSSCSATTASSTPSCWRWALRTRRNGL